MLSPVSGWLGFWFGLALSVPGFGLLGFVGLLGAVFMFEGLSGFEGVLFAVPPPPPPPPEAQLKIAHNNVKSIKFLNFLDFFFKFRVFITLPPFTLKEINFLFIFLYFV